MKKIVKKLIDKQTLTLIIGGLIINALCFFIYAFPVKAAGGNSHPLPYYVNYYKDDYFNFSYNNWVEIIEYYAENIHPDYDLIFLGEPEEWNSAWGSISIYFVKSSDGTITLRSSDLNYNVDYNMFDFSSDYVVYSGYVYQERLLFSYSNPTNAQVSYSAGRFSSSYSLLGAKTMNSYGYTPLYPYYLKSGSEFYFNGDKLVFANGEPSPFHPAGHATPPDPFNNPLTSNNHTLPREVPQAPTYNNYTWNTYNPPAFDDTSIIDAIKSLGDKIEYTYVYLKDGIHGEIYTLTGNIKAYFEYIGETIQYYGGLIIDNIQNLITTFYNNMVSLGEDIAGKITTIYDFLVHPLDTVELTTQLNNSTFVSAVRTTKTQISTFNGMFSNISQPENVVFTIDLSGLWFNGGVSYLDFSILTPVLPFIRLVLGCILLYDLIVTLFTNINSYIGGNSAKNDGG